MKSHFFKLVFLGFMLTAFPVRVNGEVLLRQSIVEHETGRLSNTFRVQQSAVEGKTKAQKWLKCLKPKNGWAVLGGILVWIGVGILWLGSVGLLVWLAWLLVGNVPLAMLIGFVLYLLIGSLIISIRDKKGKARRKKNAAPKK